MPAREKALSDGVLRRENIGPVVLIVGTRPEAIKMFPVYRALKAHHIPTCLCSTGQHAEMLADALSLFGVVPDVDLKVMKPGQDLFYLTEAVLAKTKELYDAIHPSLVVVQGDTTSAMVGALSAFYSKIPVLHVEAGLRTGDLHAPFPEELNRRIITLLATVHCAPTQYAAAQLEREGVKKDSIYCTGNTVVDALYTVVDNIRQQRMVPMPQLVTTVQRQVAEGRSIVLMTAHRRESFDGGLDRIFSAMKKALQRDPALFLIFPVHPNPIVQEAVRRSQLDGLPNALLLPPLTYHDLVYVMDAALGVATDSGGISEEAVSLGKPVVILRNETDRPECLQTGQALLVGTDEEKIISGLAWMKEKAGERSSAHRSPFGDGTAGEKIAHIIEGMICQP
jgi:UDP-N-acetylglucosamine 2-epimerase (non-hydrolysing)